jgi:hypothetical protein
MINGEGDDRVVLSLDALAWLEIRDLQRKAEPIHPELLGAFERALRSTWSPQAERLRASLQRHRSHQADHADHMIGMEVCEEDVGQSEGDAVAHHLALRSFAAVEEKCLAFAHDRERCDIALDGWT